MKLTRIREIPRQRNGEAFYLYFTGGFRAARVDMDADEWIVEPVLIDGKPCSAGTLGRGQLQKLTKEHGFAPVAFHASGWDRGEYFSHWTPINPKHRNHLQRPSDLWSNIAIHLSSGRVDTLSRSSDPVTKGKIFDTLDAHEPKEAFAKFISLSLLSMDISIERVCEYYNEQLDNHMSSGDIDGEGASNTQDSVLFSHVHSFFLHLGAARDYLGAFLAAEVGLDPQECDSLARLVAKLRRDRPPTGALFDFLVSESAIAPHPNKLNGYSVGGWMEEVTALRNALVHKRPYGARFSERLGRAVLVSAEHGLARYVRDIHYGANSVGDALEVMLSHYVRSVTFFHDAALNTGCNTSMLTLTDQDLVSFAPR